MSNPTDRRVARTIGETMLAELDGTDLRTATERQLVYQLGMARFALRKLVETIDDPAAGQTFALPLQLHCFASSNGVNYVCQHCDAAVDHQDLWAAACFEPCEGRRAPSIPDSAHHFVNEDVGHFYVCTRCGRRVAREDVWRIAVLEPCEAGEPQ